MNLLIFYYVGFIKLVVLCGLVMVDSYIKIVNGEDGVVLLKWKEVIIFRERNGR